MPDTAIAVTNTGHAFTHRPTESSWLTFVRKSWFEGAFAGDGFGGSTFAGYGTAHGRCLIASKVFHTAAVVGGVTSGGRETQAGGGFTHEQFTVRAWRAFLPVATGRYKVCGDDAASG